MNVRNGYSPEATTLCRLRLEVDFYTLAALYLDDCVRLRTSDVTRQKPQKRPDVCPALFVLLECP